MESTVYSIHAVYLLIFCIFFQNYYIMLVLFNNVLTV